MSDDIYCRTCGEALTRDGCPNRQAHANMVRLMGFQPDPRGAPSRPGPGPGPDIMQATEDDGHVPSPDTDETRN